MAEVSLSPEAERIFPVADALCRQLGIAIVAPEHVLVAALSVLLETGMEGLPAAETLMDAAVAVHGSSDEALATEVMWGSAAREALNATVRAVSEAGVSVIDPRVFALGVIESGQVNPGFFTAAGMTPEAARAALRSQAPEL